MIVQSLFKEMLENLNTQLEVACKGNKDAEKYQFRFEVGKFQDSLKGNDKEKITKFRTLRLYKDNLTTHERTTISETHYVANNPAEFLKSTYKERLFKDFLKHAVNVRIFSLMNKVEQEAAADAVEEPMMNESR